MFQSISLSDTVDLTKAPFCHAVRAGDFLFVSGQVAKDALRSTDKPLPLAGDRPPIAEQAIAVMENLKTVLNEAGAGFDRVVMARIFLRDFRDYDIVNGIYTSHLTPGRFPCRTTVGVVGLAEQCDVEIDLIVYCGM